MMPSPDMPQRVDSRAAIRGIAEVIGSKYYPPGQLAELRRLQPEAPRGAAFWRLLLDHAPESVGNPALECDWAVVLRGMALMVPYHQPSEDDARGAMGEALAKAGVSELRFLRLVRAGRDQLPDELRRLARLMASRGEGFDWGDAFWLLRTASADGAERVRRNIARDYYRKLHALQRAATSGTRAA
jgi:CRISPR system Cascade subunit CasB